MLNFKFNKIIQIRILGLIILVLNLLIYWPVHNTGFIDLDDYNYVVKNENVNNGFSQEGVVWAFTTFDMANWHPLTWLSHMLDCEIYGLKPAGHHLTSLFLHTCTALLIFLFFRETTRKVLLSFLIAFFFATHPLRLESVAWIAERKDVLCGFFWMITLISYRHYCQKPNLSRYFLITIPFLFALAAKPMAVTLPCALMLLDFWPLNRIKMFNTQATADNWDFQDPTNVPYPRFSGFRIIAEKAPLLIISTCSALITFFAQAQSGAVTSLENLTIPYRILNTAISYIEYIKKTFIPIDLALIYPHPGKRISIPAGVICAILFIAISIVVIRYWKKKPYLLFGWFWYTGLLVPVIGLVQVGNQALADRYTYLPSIGIMVILVFGLNDLFSKSKFPKRMAILIFGFFTLYWPLLTLIQLQHWKSSESIFWHTLTTTEKNIKAHFALGSIFLRQKEVEKAEKHFNEALKYNPTYAAALINLGTIISGREDYQGALRQYQLALKSEPKSFQALFNMGNVLVRLERQQEAMAAFLKALSIDPKSQNTHFLIGLNLFKSKKTKVAKHYFTQLLELNPKHTGALNYLGRIAKLEGDDEAALEFWHKAITINTQYAEVYNLLGNLFEEREILDEAFYYYMCALHAYPNYNTAKPYLDGIKEKICRNFDCIKKIKD